MGHTRIFKISSDIAFSNVRMSADTDSSNIDAHAMAHDTSQYT